MVKCRKYCAIDGRACLQRLGESFYVARLSESRVQDRHEPTLLYHFIDSGQKKGPLTERGLRLEATTTLARCQRAQPQKKPPWIYLSAAAFDLFRRVK